MLVKYVDDMLIGGKEDEVLQLLDKHIGGSDGVACREVSDQVSVHMRGAR